jgi:hypothetical protein
MISVFVKTIRGSYGDSCWSAFLRLCLGAVSSCRVKSARDRDRDPRRRASRICRIGPLSSLLPASGVRKNARLSTGYWGEKARMRGRPHRSPHPSLSPLAGRGSCIPGHDPPEPTLVLPQTSTRSTSSYRYRSRNRQRNRQKNRQKSRSRQPLVPARERFDRGS